MNIFTMEPDDYKWKVVTVARQLRVVTGDAVFDISETAPGALQVRAVHSMLTIHPECANVVTFTEAIQ